MMGELFRLHEGVVIQYYELEHANLKLLRYMCREEVIEFVL